MSIEEKIKNAKEDSWLKDSVSEEEFKQIKESTKTDDLISRNYEIEQIKKAQKEGKTFNYDTLIDFVKVLPTIPQTDSETEYWKERAKSYERTIVALQKGIAETDTDSILADIKAEIDNESIGYPPSADYYKAIKKAVRIIDKHISGKE